MNKSFKFYIFFIFYFTSIFAFENHIPEPDLFFHKVMDQTINSLSKKYSFLHPCGIGIDKNFEYLQISFQVQQELTKDEIRCVLIDCTEEFLKTINSSEKIRPFLKTYPFKDAGIALFINNSNNQEIFHPNICCASTNGKEIKYKTQSPENLFKYKETTTESYQEALKLIQVKDFEKKE